MRSPSCAVASSWSCPQRMTSGPSAMQPLLRRPPAGQAHALGDVAAQHVVVQHQHARSARRRRPRRRRRTRSSSLAGRWPFTAMSLRFQRHRTGRDAVAGEHRRDHRAGKLERRRAAPRPNQRRYLAYSRSRPSRSGTGSPTTARRGCRAASAPARSAPSRSRNASAAWNSPCRARWVRSPDTTTALGVERGHERSTRVDLREVGVAAEVEVGEVDQRDRASPHRPDRGRSAPPHPAPAPSRGSG